MSNLLASDDKLILSKVFEEVLMMKKLIYIANNDNYFEVNYFNFNFLIKKRYKIIFFFSKNHYHYKIIINNK